MAEDENLRIQEFWLLAQESSQDYQALGKLYSYLLSWDGLKIHSQAVLG